MSNKIKAGTLIAIDKDIQEYACFTMVTRDFYPCHVIVAHGDPENPSYAASGTTWQTMHDIGLVTELFKNAEDIEKYRKDIVVEEDTITSCAITDRIAIEYATDMEKALDSFVKQYDPVTCAKYLLDRVNCSNDQMEFLLQNTYDLTNSESRYLTILKCLRSLPEQDLTRMLVTGSDFIVEVYRSKEGIRTRILLPNTPSKEEEFSPRIHVALKLGVATLEY